MKFKRIIVAALLLTLTITLFGCEFLKQNLNKSKEDIVYMSQSQMTNGYTVTGFSSTGENKEIVYVKDIIKGITVETVGDRGWVAHKYASFNCDNIRRLYFPWSITHYFDTTRWYRSQSINYPQYIISCTTASLIPYGYFENMICIIPKTLYNRCSESKIEEKRLMPANISYFFNYDESPNENYFFVDLLEETGKLTKPPYDPKREGYTFGGWYTEAECVNPFNFEEDSVTINFDEEGNRIYEEFCLYAKWDKE